MLPVSNDGRITTDMNALRRLKRRVGRFLFKAAFHRLWAFRYVYQFKAVEGSPPEPSCVKIQIPKKKT